MAPMRLIALLVICLTAFAQQRSFSDYVAHAKEQSDLTESRGFVLEADLLRGKKTVGKYRLKYLSKSRWTDETTLENFSERRVGSDRQYHVVRHGEFTSDLFDLHDAVPIRIAIAEPLNARFKTEMTGGVPVDCFAGVGSRVCFDSRSGLLVRSTPFQYSAYMDFLGKKIPSRIEVGNMSIKITSMLPNDLSGEDFPTAGMLGPFAGCFQPTAGLPIDAPSPQYPELAKERRISGAATLWLLVGADGRVGPMKLLGTAHPFLEKAAADAVLRWTYSPAMCSGKAVPHEKIVKVNFYLGHPPR